MKSVGVAALALAISWICVASWPAVAQPQLSPELRNPNITFDYYEPRDPAYLEAYKRLQGRQILEELGQFLAPVRWPKKIRLIMKQCPEGTPAPQVFYSKIEYSLTLCYQWFADLETFGRPRPSFATHRQVVVGGVVGIVLHEAARAVFDLLRVPRLGSEEDAADQVTSFVGLQFGKDVAQAVTKGTYWVWDTYDYRLRSGDKQYNFASKASIAPQRMRNTACMAYGADPVVFKDFAGVLGSRADNCANEYQQAARAFEKTIKRHVDLDMMKKVQSVAWLPLDDLR
jgi:hypothetical protein